MGLNIAEIKFDRSRAHAKLWRKTPDVEFLLIAADIQIGFLQHRKPKRLLVPKIMIKHPLIDAGATGDFIHSGARQALGRKFIGRRIEDAAAGRVGPATAH